MGAQKSLPLQDDTLDEKDRVLFLNKAEILELYKVFHIYSCASSPQDCERSLEEVTAAGYPLPVERVQEEAKVWRGGPDGTKLMRVEQFLSMPCLRTNPFAPRLFYCFKDAPHGMCLDSFMQLASVMNHKAPLEIKNLVAFRVFDFNDDGVLTEADVTKMLQVLTGQRDVWQEAAHREQRVPDWCGNRGGATVKWDAEFPTRDTSGTTGTLREKAESGLGAAKRKAKARMELPTSPDEEAGRRQSAVLTGLEDATAKIASKIFKSVDIDESDELGEAEFEKVLGKIPDFRLKFSLRIP